MSRDYSTLKVVVIEDEAFTRQLIAQELRQVGIRKIHQAADGGSGLQMVALIRPDIVFCDIHMEPVDGLKFLEALRAVRIHAIAGTPVVFLTADAEEQTVFSARDLKVDGYLVKPVSPADLKKRIDALVPARSEAR